MIFIYHENAKKEKIIFTDDAFLHLFKSRRTEINETITVSNLKDNFLYQYKIINISKKTAEAILISKKENAKITKNNFHLGWCIIDPKDIKKTLPFLNQLGVSKISFIYSEFSQKNYKLNLEKLKKILINSSQQCGRQNLMELEIINSVKLFLEKNQNSYILDFAGQKLSSIKTNLSNQTFLIGPEGGFSPSEKKLFTKNKIITFNQNLVLTSENAVVAISCKCLL